MVLAGKLNSLKRKIDEKSENKENEDNQTLTGKKSKTVDNLSLTNDTTKKEIDLNEQSLMTISTLENSINVSSFIITEQEKKKQIEEAQIHNLKENLETKVNDILEIDISKRYLYLYEPIKIQLPLVIEQLLRDFYKFEYCCQQMKLLSKKLHFLSIKETYKCTYNQEFSRIQLEKFYRIYKGLFRFIYQKQGNSKPTESFLLVQDYSKKFEERLKIFQKACLVFIKAGKFSIFLKQHNMIHTEKYYWTQKIWPFDFDPNVQISLIPGREIDIQQQPKSSFDINDILFNEQQEEKQKKIEEVFKFIENQSPIKKLTKDNIQQQLLDKMIEKEKIQKEYQEKENQKEQSKETVQSKLLSSAEIVKAYFTRKQVQSAFLEKFLDFIKENSASNNFTKQELHDNVVQLSQIIPQYIKIVENPSGRIIRINKDQNKQNLINLFQQCMNSSNNLQELSINIDLANKISRYEDSLFLIKKLVQSQNFLNEQDQQNFANTIKNIVQKKRNAINSFVQYQKKPEYNLTLSQHQKEVFKTYLEKIKLELHFFLDEIIEILTINLIPNTERTKTKVFYMKLKADCCRYFLDINHSEIMFEKVRQYYLDAWEYSLKGLNPSSQLHLCLNYSVFFYENLKDVEKAIQISEKCIMESLDNLDQLQDEDYKETTTIMQYIQDCLIKWKNE